MRFTVGYCLYPHGENNSIETRMRLIFDDGLPATELNRHLVMAQLNRDKPLGTTVYQLCIYLNYLDMRGLEAVNATMDNLYNFLCELYIDGLPYGCNKAPKSYNNICDYVDTLSKLYDMLALRGYPLDDSLYTRSQKMMLLPDPKTNRRKGRIVKKGEHLTFITFPDCFLQIRTMLLSSPIPSGTRLNKFAPSQMNCRLHTAAFFSTPYIPGIALTVLFP